jgi:hypothetical protein
MFTKDSQLFSFRLVTKNYCLINLCDKSSPLPTHNANLLKECFKKFQLSLIGCVLSCPPF